MSDRGSRRLPVVGGRVQCTPDKVVPVDRCGFCVHSALVVVGGGELPSPARAYCSRCQVTSGVDMAKVEAVVCDDARGEGFRSITSIIS
ncbi:hypothetical protein [Methanoculleus bourgensis]|uniref:hypothetical protein n=1 Tax=Methanoculleus bourgensis TaxID=83986 RepID=UPI0022EF2227|nr:hypothetical protein [Methanoculleus bourgensis]GLI45609.1 hypothetical protein MBOURGENBZM_04010 [Methanoculleus bourgensis]